MTPAAYMYICDGDIDNPVLTYKKMDWPEKYPHWQEIPLVMAQPAQQEPVARCMEHGECFGGECIYTSPPASRPWVGLTYGEVLEQKKDDPIQFYRAIEAKLREKNT